MTRTYILRAANYRSNASTFRFAGFEMKRMFLSYEQAEMEALAMVRNDWTWMNLCSLGKTWSEITHDFEALKKFFQAYGISFNEAQKSEASELFIPNNINDYELRILLRLLKYPFF